MAPPRSFDVRTGGRFTRSSWALAGVLLPGLLLAGTVMAQAQARASGPGSPVSGLVTTPEPVRSSQIREEFGITRENFDKSLLRLVMSQRELVLARIRQAFLDYIDRPRSIQVTLGDPSLSQLLQGRFELIEADMTDGLYENIGIEHSRMRLENVVVDYEELFFNERLRFREQGRVEFLLVIAEREINRVLLKNAGNMKIRNPNIELRNGTVEFSGRAAVPVGETSFRIRGRFEIRKATQVHFVPDRVRLGFLPIPGAISRTIFDKLNPIADLGRINVQIQPDLIRARTDHLYVLTREMLPVLETIEKERGLHGR